MTKVLPIDTVIMLHNKLGALTARNPLRKLIIEEAATFYGVSSATIYRNMINCLLSGEQIIIIHV
jgi:hypothetical protein